MKIIVAGFSKTGTKSMVSALEGLDYQVYDWMDHFWYHEKEWRKIFSSGGCVEDFKQMYKNVDAVVDVPAYIFWEEIHQAFPDAKIILTTRNEDSWFQSWKAQIEQIRQKLAFQIFKTITPIGRRFAAFNHDFGCVITGSYQTSMFTIKPANEMLMKRNFRQHQAYCLQNAPKDKLLVYNVKEGWEPLCHFLGKNIPDKPFPHENADGAIVDKVMMTHPVAMQMKRELFVAFGLLTGLFAFVFYRIF